MIINIFNSNNSYIQNDYKNTLTIVRMLSYLLNNGACSKKKLYERLEFYGYPTAYLDHALEKCFNYGLVSSDHGCRINDLNDSTEIKISNVTTTYFEKLIQKTSYLQYVCEDTPMPHEKIVPIDKKYPKPNSKSVTQKYADSRLESVKLFLEFLKTEELLEKNYIETHIDIKWKDYLFEFGIKLNNSYLSISDYIVETSLKQLSSNSNLEEI
nr:hypothetical protein [Desulfobacula sp.]